MTWLGRPLSLCIEVINSTAHVSNLFWYAICIDYISREDHEGEAKNTQKIGKFFGKRKKEDDDEDEEDHSVKRSQYFTFRNLKSTSDLF